MRELEIADLNDTRERDAFLVHIFRFRSRTGLARNHLHSVSRLNGIEMRNVMAVEEPAPPRSVAGVAAMEHGEMDRIDAVLNEVEPVIIIVSSELDVFLAAVFYKGRISWQRRRIFFVGAHISEDKPAQLPHGIRKVLYLFVILAVSRLPGLFQAIARYVEEPRVIGTANAALLDVAIFKRGAAVRTMEADKPNLSVQVAEQNQLFAQNFKAERNVAEFLGGADNQPVTTKPFSRRCAETDVGDIDDANFCELSHALFLSRAAVQQLCDLGLG